MTTPQCPWSNYWSGVVCNAIRGYDLQYGLDYTLGGISHCIKCKICKAAFFESLEGLLFYQMIEYGDPTDATREAFCQQFRERLREHLPNHCIATNSNPSDTTQPREDLSESPHLSAV